MPYLENRPNTLSEGLQIPGLVQSQNPVEQLAFPGPVTPLPASLTSEWGEQNTPDLADLDTKPQPASDAKRADPLTPQPLSDSTGPLLPDTIPAPAMPKTS